MRIRVHSSGFHFYDQDERCMKHRWGVSFPRRHLRLVVYVPLIGSKAGSSLVCAGLPGSP
jgi:hypothetical protein